MQILYGDRKKLPLNSQYTGLLVYFKTDFKLPELYSLTCIITRIFVLVILVSLFGCSLNPFSNSGRSASQIDSSIEVKGKGSVGVALLLPKSASGEMGQIGQSFQNAAELALNNSTDSNIQLLIIDTNATFSGGREAARLPISNGAELILGPVSSPAVNGATPVAQIYNVPIIVFNQNVEHASPSVYLLENLLQDDINRIISYSVSQGKQTFAAILPNDDFGTLIEENFRQAVNDNEGQINTVFFYNYDPATNIGANELLTLMSDLNSIADQIDAVLFPVGGIGAKNFGETLSYLGINNESVQILGTSLWDVEGVRNSSSLEGGWYPSSTNINFYSFSEKYIEEFEAVPPRKASLAYDATILAIGLTSKLGSNRFNQEVLTNSAGFRGIDGLFRFKSDGTIERGLAVFQVINPSPQIVDPAPYTFSDSSF